MQTIVVSCLNSLLEYNNFQSANLEYYLVELVHLLVDLERLGPFDADSHLPDVPHSDVVHRGRVELFEDRVGLKVLRQYNWFQIL